jgi:hypothetical protein
MPYSGKYNESYSHRKVKNQCRFSRKSKTNAVWSKGKNLGAIPQMPLQFSVISYMSLISQWHMGPTSVTDSGISGIVIFFSGIWGIIPKNFFQNRTNGTIWSKLRYDSWSFQIRAGFQSGNIFSSALPFRTKSVLTKRSSLNSTLTSNGTDLGEEDYTKIVDNFDSFLESINTPLSDEWFRSNGFWKLSGAAGNSNFWTEWTDLTNSKFRSSFKWQPRELQIAKW